MIWYILYPFRGTTEPPKLPPGHPLRQAFYHHGLAISRHWLLSILLSVVVAVFLCYPVVLVNNSPTFRSFKVAHHAWTSAQLYGGSVDILPDINIRQAWVHGSYMKVLDSGVLQEALRIQNVLLGAPTNAALTTGDGSYSRRSQEHCLNQPTLSWGLHSPLMYWNCSVSAIEQDADILHTINSHTHDRTTLNITLRPSSVFAGKSFSSGKLTAADALVITLFEFPGADVGTRWIEQSVRLAQAAPDRWSIYPKNGRPARSQTYDFRFKPMGFGDDFLLVIIYSVVSLIVLSRLRRLRGVKSQAGLLIALCTQVAISILASLTLCGLFNVNLATVPREVFPALTLFLGLENMFRLVDTVVEQSPELPTVERVARALGDVGPLAFAGVGQNLGLLYLLSKLSYQGVAQFCMFSFFALTFDFLFHLTFFVAVLSVDVRRTELRDSLERVNDIHTNANAMRTEREGWSTALFRSMVFREGRVPGSTRIAGQAFLICFVIVLNYHFWEGEKLRSLLRLLRPGWRRGNKHVLDEIVPSLPPINQARSPGEWLRMQEYDTGKEVISFIKPKGFGFVARVYEPLTIVLKDADRAAAPHMSGSVLHKTFSLMTDHIFSFVLILVSCIAVTTLLMHYLLWDEIPNDESMSTIAEPTLTIETLPISHKLDIADITGNGKGHLLTISTDRSMSGWYLDSWTGRYTHHFIKSDSGSKPVWPVIASTIDEDSCRLAVCSDTGLIGIWSLERARFIQYHNVALKDIEPLLFTMASFKAGDPNTLHLLIVTLDGWMIDIDLTTQRIQHHCIYSGSLISSKLSGTTEFSVVVLTLAQHGDMHITKAALGGRWHTSPLISLPPQIQADRRVSKVRYILALKNLDLFAAVRLHEVDMFDVKTKKFVANIQTEHIQGVSMRIIHLKRRSCGTCQGPAVKSLALVYTDYDTKRCMMHTFTNEGDINICLRPQDDDNDTTCNNIHRAKMMTYRIDDPGAWETSGAMSVLGIREQPALPLIQDSGLSKRHTTSRNVSPFKFSKQDQNEKEKSKLKDPQVWEAWSLSSTGMFHTQPLSSDITADANISLSAGKVNQQIIVANPGPATRLDKRSIAIAFGNSVKIVSVTSDRIEDEGDRLGNGGPAASIGRRRRIASKKAQ
ncbi:hypothetical protein M501DRAFT_998747 [Patellaria atrata CBS 101060]|uniref:SSD domain-containing protein n=1 Tax=Patellaria atrata CBS 101060 TaxID=1346257 RepID=A0A9P4SII9_9PEZI|nr:hypothetical protein M501DRAFT_998747 [Patellaria atrata CBS 101060]